MRSYTSAFLSHFGLDCSTPQLPFLEKITAAYSNIPYENLTKIIKCDLKKGDYIDSLRKSDDLIGGYIENGTGGTCFSLTSCLYEILIDLGYEINIVMADRSYGPNTHCALIAVINGNKYLLDPGFLVSKPIALRSGTFIIPTGINNLILENNIEEHRCSVSTERNNERKYSYTLKTEPCPYETFMKHWLDSFSWPMMNSLVITRRIGERQIYLRNTFFQETDSEFKKNSKIKLDRLPEFVTRFGISSEVWEKAGSIWLNQKKERKSEAARSSTGKTGNSRTL